MTISEPLQTDADLKEFSRVLKKLTVETALNAGLADHLGYEHSQPSAKGNTRNGYSKKQILTGDGEFELNTRETGMAASKRN